MRAGGCRRWLIAGALVVVAVSAAMVALPEGRYLLRAGVEEARILARRQPIERLLADPSTPGHIAGLLRLVLEVRRFAVDSLGLAAGSTYTSYADVGRDTLLLVLSASERYRLVPHRWRYPIVGAVPYKGFFDPDQARRAARGLEKRGFDVYLRPAGAFSTLGWFSDPLLSTALDRDSVELVATVVHELAHNTLYVKSATPFNESFANFVGYRGAERFFRSRSDTAGAARARAGWDREIRAARFFTQLTARLDSLYSSSTDTAALERGREEIFGWARQAAGRPEWRINNALVIAARLYRTDLEVFDRWLAGAGGDVVRAIGLIRERVGEQGDPYEALWEGGRGR